MGTSGVDLLMAAFAALDPEEQSEAVERLQERTLAKAASDERESERFLRSLVRVREVLGHAPTVDEYKAVRARLVAAGEDVESFSRVYRRYGSWRRVHEALDLSQRTTARRIEARFASRKLGKVWRYSDETLRTALLEAAAEVGHPPTTAEFDWWREREMEKARAEGNDDLHLPSDAPYRKRWGSWAAALIHFGFDEREIQDRLEATRFIPRGHDPDAGLPAELPIADLREPSDADELPLSLAAANALCGAWAALPRRSRYVLTGRLGLSGPQRTLRELGEPIGVHLSRVLQVQREAEGVLLDATSEAGASDVTLDAVRRALGVLRRVVS